MLNLKLALRFIFKKPLQYLLIILVLTIGVTVFYFILNISDGLKNVALLATAENSSYINVRGNFDFNSYNDLDVANFRNEAFNNDNRITDISYTLSVPAELNRLFLTSNSTVLLKGIDFVHGGNIQKISSRITNQPYSKIPETIDHDPNYFGEIVIGNRLMTNLGFTSEEHAHNKPLKVSLLLDNNQIEEFIFKIVAVYRTDQVELSEKLAFTTIETLHKIPAFKSQVNAIEISTTNPLNSDDVAHKLNDTLSKYYSNYSLNNWQDGNKYIVNALYIEEVSILLIQVFTALAISFGLASIITFTIREKNHQIGILKALGLTDKNVLRTFLIQIIILLIIGISLGLFAGNQLSIISMKVFKRPNSERPLVNVLVGLNNRFTLITILTITFSSILASIIPLKMAERLKIIDVIRSE